MELLTERFWEKVDKNGPTMPNMQTPCWVWTASRYRFGHGGFSLSGRTVEAHRVAWEMANGPIPDGLDVLHRCDNPPCVNAEHLFLGTHADNMHDMYAKGRRVAARGEQHGRAKVTESDVKLIFRLHSAGWTRTKIGKKFSLVPTSISKILSRKNWAHVQLEQGI